MSFEQAPEGAAKLLLVGGVPLLHPEPQVFEAMIEGWRNQMLARNLAASTITGREKQVRAFQAHAMAFPWEWSPALADEWFADLRAVRQVTRSTVRGYQVALRGFCEFVTDPAYGWAVECENRFGTHPVQVITEMNSAVHVADIESEPRKRAFTREELQALFDYADEQVERKRALGRKGWMSAFRDATLMKVAYSYGTRRTETQMLDVADFGRTPKRRSSASTASSTSDTARPNEGHHPSDGRFSRSFPGPSRCSTSGLVRSARCSASTRTRRPGPRSGRLGSARRP